MKLKVLAILAFLALAMTLAACDQETSNAPAPKPDVSIVMASKADTTKALHYLNVVSAAGALDRCAHDKMIETKVQISLIVPVLQKIAESYMTRKDNLARVSILASAAFNSSQEGVLYTVTLNADGVSITQDTRTIDPSVCATAETIIIKELDGGFLKEVVIPGFRKASMSLSSPGQR